jgi:hypothetical protein
MPGDKTNGISFRLNRQGDIVRAFANKLSKIQLSHKNQLRGIKEIALNIEFKKCYTHIPRAFQTNIVPEAAWNMRNGLLVFLACCGLVVFLLL